MFSCQFFFEFLKIDVKIRWIIYVKPQKLALQIDKKQKAINACRQLVERVSTAVLMLTLKYLIKEN